MSGGELLTIQPTELTFPFESKKQSSCSLQLINKTDFYVAFKVKTTNPKKYCVRPNTGIVMPRTTCDITVTMQAQKEVPPDMQCKDKFLLQNVIVNYGATTKDFTPEMFNKEDGKVVEEYKLRVVYAPPPQPPSTVLEGSEEETSPRASPVENGNQTTSLFDAVSKSFDGSNAISSTEVSKSFDGSKEISSMEVSKSCDGSKEISPTEDSVLISSLTQEKSSAIQQNQKLIHDLELLRKQSSKRGGAGFSILFVVLVGLLGILAGYLVKT